VAYELLLSASRRAAGHDHWITADALWRSLAKPLVVKELICLSATAYDRPDFLPRASPIMPEPGEQPSLGASTYYFGSEALQTIPQGETYL
jgi:hypothetical protein